MYKIAVIRGDGAGVEVIDSTLRVLEATNIDFEFIDFDVGQRVFRDCGFSVTRDTLTAMRDTDTCLFGATTTPSISNYVSAIATIRRELDLYANVRPIRTFPCSRRIGVDFVIVRENTEGMYSGIERRNEDVAYSTRVITKEASDRILRYAFGLAQHQNRGSVTVVHKNNILRETCGLFRETAHEVSRDYPTIHLSEELVDSTAFNMMQDPERYQIIVTTNLFGDILSDEALYLVGGMGLGYSANIGGSYALFEPIHGTAPDIAGKNLVNPIGAIMSAKMMLDHLNENKVAEQIEQSVHRTLGEGALTRDLGGSATTEQMTNAIINKLEEQND